jgi:hypothetical protein
MPLPDKQKGESKKDFLERCMGNSTTNKDFPENKQRYAVCNNIWSKKKEESSATVAKIGSDEYIFAEKKKGDKTGGRGLYKPFRTPNASRKFAVYVKNGKDGVKILRWADPDMRIRRDNPEALKSFRARFKCDTSPKAKNRDEKLYWVCRTWRADKSVKEVVKSSVDMDEWDGETLWDQADLLAEFPEFLEAEDVEEDQDI